MSKVADCPTCGGKSKIKEAEGEISYHAIQNAEIYNVLGKKVMNVVMNKTSESIDISNLASGVYMIKYNIETTLPKKQSTLQQG